MTGFFSERISVEALADLQAIPNPAQNAIRAVRDTSAAGDGSRDAGWYVFRAGDSTAEDLPDVVAPNSGDGRWRAFVGGDVGSGSGGGSGGGIVLDFDSSPNRAPAFAGEIWIRLEAGTADGSIVEIWQGVLTAGELGNVNALNVGGGAWIELRFIS